MLSKQPAKYFIVGNLDTNYFASMQMGENGARMKHDNPTIAYTSNDAIKRGREKPSI